MCQACVRQWGYGSGPRQTQSLPPCGLMKEPDISQIIIQINVQCDAYYKKIDTWYWFVTVDSDLVLEVKEGCTRGGQ